MEIVWRGCAAPRSDASPSAHRIEPTPRRSAHAMMWHHASGEASRRRALWPPPSVLLIRRPVLLRSSHLGADCHFLPPISREMRERTRCRRGRCAELAVKERRSRPRGMYAEVIFAHPVSWVGPGDVSAGRARE